MITVRPGLFPDVETIASFQVLMARETERMELDPPTVIKGVQAVIDDPGKGKYWVAEEAGQVVGCLLTVPEWSDWRNATVLWIHSVYVVPASRGKGAYGALYRHVQVLVKQNPARYRGLRLYVDKSNQAAQQVYEKLGMNGDHYQLFEWMV